ncbi:hypothetical protein H6F98_07855 [Microcoleus sp. FACHB-SPT15]|uniref:hypothetical protein n=1 Tax=Microcoleus sp. FACHB-SPT15 TaxID=2692830 RepID=UPI00177AD0B7|nr:hypothetical protein [Microcoleus sp. FACHB-SPT15]MBD1805362.1 hypothetical protein [Microcoleus sp. FACHB-SPT15]
MENTQTTFVKPAQTIQPIQLVTPAQVQPDSANVSLTDGNSPVAVIMAISVLIGAIASLIKVLVPVMLQLPQKKTK